MEEVRHDLISEEGPDLDKEQRKPSYGEQQIARGMAIEVWQCSRDIEKTCLLETRVRKY